MKTIYRRFVIGLLYKTLALKTTNASASGRSFVTFLSYFFPPCIVW